MTELESQKATSSRLKYSPRSLNYSNLDPQYFAKTRPKIIHNLAISQLALENISSQNQRKLIQSIKNIKCSHNLKLRLGHCSPKNMRKVTAPLKTFKNLKTLKLDFFGFPQNGLSRLRALPKRLASNGRRLKNLSLDFTSSELKFDPALSLTCSFMKRQITLNSLCVQFQQTLCGNLSPLLKRLQKSRESLTDLSLNFSQLFKMRKESMYDFTSRGLSNLPNLKRLNLKLGTPKNPLDSSLAFNLEKSKELRSFDFDFQNFYIMIKEDFEYLARQLQAWSSSLKVLHLKFPKAAPNILENFAAEGLAGLKAVKSLKLEFKIGTSVTLDFMESFAKGLKTFEVLEILHLTMAGCALDNDKLEVFINGIKEKVSLKDLKLNLGHNNVIDRKGISDFFSALKELKELEALNLSMESCGIDNSNIGPLASSLEELKKLKKLKLCLHFKETDSISAKLAIEMGELDMNRLSDSFSGHPDLATLKLNLLNIKMSDKDQTNLVDNLRKMKSLRKLELFFNGNKSEIRSSMKNFLGLGNLSNLQDLSLNIMKSSQEDLWDLFHSVGGMNKLRALRLGFYQKKADFNEAMEKYSDMMKNLGGGLKSFKMIFYRCDAIESDFTTDFLRGLGELKQVENVRFELIMTGLKYYDAETVKRVAEKIINLKTLKKFHYGGDDII